MGFGVEYKPEFKLCSQTQFRKIQTLEFPAISMYLVCFQTSDFMTLKKSLSLTTEHAESLSQGLAEHHLPFLYTELKENRWRA